MTLREKITTGQFVVTAEMTPPQGADGDIIRRKAVHFQKGVDGIILHLYEERLYLLFHLE